MERTIALIIFLACCLLGCKDLPILPACQVDTNILITPNANCTAPCEKTFRLRDPELLPNGARISWMLTKGNTELPLDNPSALEFDYTFTEAGEDYLASVSVVFEFEGCDLQLSQAFGIGVDQPVAAIHADRQECIVGDCSVIFTAEVENADSWYWSFPGDNNDYQGDSIVIKSFNERPDTLEVTLTAFNIGDTVADLVTIFVEPATFIRDGGDLPPSTGTVLHISEQADGSFTLIGNTGTHTYTELMSRNGSFLPNSRANVNYLGADYDERYGFDCFELNGNKIIVGDTYSQAGGNQDAYLVAFDEDFNAMIETAFFHPQDGAESAFAITTTPDGGYLTCGGKSQHADSQPTGMLFFKLNESLQLEETLIRLNSSPFNTAFGIVSSPDGYAVAGQAINPGSGIAESCFFEMNHDFEIINSIEYLGSGILPNEIINIGNRSFLILGRDGATGIIRAVGDTNWEMRFANSNFYKGLSLEGNRIAVAGQQLISGTETPVLLTLNAEDGSIADINEKYHAAAPGRIFSLSQTKDRGFILGGRQPGDPHPTALIIRTNKFGKVK